MVNYTKAWRSFSLAAFNKSLLLTGLALALAGCAPLLDEPRQYHWNKEWTELKTYWPWQPNQRPFEAWFPAGNTPLYDACQLLPVDGRVTTQNGVSDYVAYRQCWDYRSSRGYYASGQRLRNRPEPLN